MPATPSLSALFSLDSQRRPLQAALVVLCLIGYGCRHADSPAPEQPSAAVESPATATPAATPAAAAEQGSPAGAPAAEGNPAATGSIQAAAGFHEFFMHDECIGDFPPQPDTCLHKRLHEKSFTFGGTPGTVYDVKLRIRGIFEPTTIEGGETPYAQHPYFKAGGKVTTLDWSYWHIEVSEPKQTYYLNHYPKVGHTIYKEDYEATIPVAGGAKVVVRVIDGNDRQIDNGRTTGPDRQQIIAGVVDKPLAGQMLRLDVLGVQAR